MVFHPITNQALALKLTSAAPNRLLTDVKMCNVTYEKKAIGKQMNNHVADSMTHKQVYNV